MKSKAVLAEHHSKHLIPMQLSVAVLENIWSCWFTYVGLCDYVCVQASFSVLQPLVYGQFPLLNGTLWVVCLWELAVLPL